MKQTTQVRKPFLLTSFLRKLGSSQGEIEYADLTRFLVKYPNEYMVAHQDILRAYAEGRVVGGPED